MAKKNRKRRALRPRVERRTAPGTVPGTVRVNPDSPPSTIRVISYGPEVIDDAQLEDVGKLKSLLGRQAVTWVNVDGLGDGKILTQLGKIFGIHHLALEDVVNVHQIAKVEDFGDQLFIVARMFTTADDTRSEQVSVFLGDNFVLTFQERPGDCLEPIRQRLRHGRGRIRQLPADYLAYAILDAIIDGYFPVVDQCGQSLDELDDQIAKPDVREVLAELHTARNELMMLRRSVRPLREAILKLVAHSSPLISEKTQVYLRDCYDHTVQLIDLLESYREICAGLRDYHMAVVGQRMNEIMKVLTIIATIFIPLSFIAGVYGMNFDAQASAWNMPELRWTFGYPFALFLMAAVASLLLVYFYRRGWLRSSRSGF